MSVFDKVSDKQVREAQVFERGNYIKPGTYTVEVLKVKEGVTRAPKNLGFIVADLKVLESSEPKLHKEGSTMTWYIQANDAFLSNFKQFVSAAVNIPVKEVGLAELKSAVSEDNPLAGVILSVNAVNVKTKADKDFTRVTFAHVADSVEELKAS